ARGEYIAFLDSDDEWLPRKLEKQIALLETQPEIDFVACLGAEAGTLFDPADYADPAQQFVRFLLVPFPPNMTRYVVRRRCLDAFGMLNPALQGAEDWELWLRLLKNGCRFGLVPEPLARYHWSADSLSLNAGIMLAGEMHIKRLY